MGLKRRLGKWLYRIFREEEELQEQATNWQRTIAVMPCVYCQRPIAPDSVFCKHCGFALAKVEHHTTGAQKLVSTLPVERVATIELPKPPKRGLNTQIEAAIIPGEKYSRAKAYHRLRRQGQV